MIPVLKRTNLYQFKVPQFSGGVNLKDDLAYLKEDQLSDCNNMWFKDNTLKTRPGINQCEGSLDTTPNGALLQAENYNTIVIDGIRYTLECEKFVQWNTDPSHVQLCFNLKLCSKENIIRLNGINITTKAIDDFNAFPIVYKNDIYVYLRFYDCETAAYKNNVYQYKKQNSNTYIGPEYILPENMYAPLILTNCNGCFRDSGSSTRLMKKGATQVEGFNLLGNYYRMEFSMYDNTSEAYKYYPEQDGEIIDTITYMEYSLPFTNKNTPGVITVEYFDQQGKNHKHTVDSPSSTPTVEKMIGDDDMYLHAFIKGNIVHFTLNAEKDSEKYDPGLISINDYIHNNMIVTAPCQSSDKQARKVMEMTQAIWYGNTSLGFSGGSRLFLCGNNDENEKSLVVWSDFENPLYFSENNYAYVGDKGQKTTGFGRQGASLIVFKEHEIYSCDYNVTTTSAEEIIDQTSIDLSTLFATFSFKLIHSKIGCDCPKTIQLCFNKLLWATSDGKVYNLTDRNQYSERNVVLVSDAIQKRLAKEDIKQAWSADWNGYYLLFIGNKVYAMDYNSYEYMNISTYSLRRSVASLPSWYMWQLPYAVSTVYGDDENMIMAFNMKINKTNFVIRGYFDENLTEDYLEESFKIISKMQTALFSLNTFDRLKRIVKVNLNLQGKQNSNVNIKCFNEQGISEFHNVSLSSNVFEGNVRVNRQIIPKIKLLRNVGFEITSLDYFELKGLNVIFKLLNNAK